MTAVFNLSSMPIVSKSPPAFFNESTTIVCVSVKTIAVSSVTYMTGIQYPGPNYSTSALSLAMSCGTNLPLA